MGEKGGEGENKGKKGNKEGGRKEDRNTRVYRECTCTCIMYMCVQYIILLETYNHADEHVHVHV